MKGFFFPTFYSGFLSVPLWKSVLNRAQKFLETFFVQCAKRSQKQKYNMHKHLFYFLEKLICFLLFFSFFLSFICFLDLYLSRTCAVLLGLTLMGLGWKEEKKRKLSRTNNVIDLGNSLTWIYERWGTSEYQMFDPFSSWTLKMCIDLRSEDEGSRTRLSPFQVKVLEAAKTSL